MNRTLKIFGTTAIVLLFFLTSCSRTRTTVKSGWKDEAYQGGLINSVMVVGISDRPEVRKMVEDMFLKQFKKHEVRAVSSAAVTLPNQKPDKLTIVAAAKKQGVDAIFVVQLLGVKEESVYHPGLTDSGPSRPDYNDLGAFYSQMGGTGGGQGYYSKEEVAKLESRLFETKTEKLIWQVIFKTSDPKSVSAVTESLSKEVMKNLSENNLIK